MNSILKFSFCCLFILLAACKQKPVETDSYGNPHVSPDIVNNPATANGDAEKKLPEFSFTETNFDFGTITSGEVLTHEFVFKNTGNADLVISQANGSCGCTVPEYPKDPIPPDEKGTIKVTFNSEGQGGQVAKTITLLANTIPSTKVLTISAEVIKK
ncbi:MAG: DUF1573 domain-containing protein [Bacteroidota bacterium]